MGPNFAARRLRRGRRSWARYSSFWIRPLAWSRAT